jgi:dephospho-CoA kinase
MPAIGITGGISTGKSTFCECLGEIVPNAKFFDADQAAHALVEVDEVKQELLREFGPGIFSSDGRLNRESLRAIVFKDAAKKRGLEQILHPRIRRQWSALAETHRDSPDFFFADIPLLYETGGETLCNRVVVVACSRSIQLERLLRRGSINPPTRGSGVASRATAEEIIDSQMPLEEKTSRADHVVWNNGARLVLVEQAKSLVAVWGKKSWTKA